MRKSSNHLWYAFVLFVTLLYKPLFAHSAQLKPVSEKIDNFLTAGEKIAYSGAVFVSFKNGEVFSKGYGFANREQQLKNSVRTIFDIGSNTKQFTSAAILKLFENSKLQLTDPLSVFFPHVPTDKSGITVHQLLSHTSGLIESVGRDAEFIDKKELLNRAFSSQLSFAPGIEFQYSNVAYSLLAAIIENVSAKSYEDFLYSDLWHPSGLENTGYLRPNWQEKTDFLAMGYRNTIDNIGTTISMYQHQGVTWNLMGNGGINTNLHDLQTWMHRLITKQVLSPQNTARLFAQQYKPDDTDTWHGGYGWFSSIEPYGTQMISHTGSNGIFQSSIRWFPKEQLTVLTLSNAQYSEVERVASTISEIVLKPSESPQALQMSPYQAALKFSQQNKPEQVKRLLQFVTNHTELKFGDKRLINRMGSHFLKNNDFLWANALFQLNLDLFPDDGNLWDSIGESQYKAKQYKAAKASFSKAIALGKDVNCYWCENAQQKLKEIERIH